MVEAFNGNILCPNKHRSEETSFHKGHLLEAETYIGGHVECLETGVYRSDIKYTFDVDPEAVDESIRNIDRDLAFGFNQIPLLMMQRVPGVSTIEKKANASGI